jgi:hypothetical protein
MRLAVSGIRAYLAPFHNPTEHYTSKLIFDGSRLLTYSIAAHHTTLWHYWAWGTFRNNDCYFYSTGTCDDDMVWHVGGLQGFPTRDYPNGQYLYCLQAITINGVRGPDGDPGRHCTPITIAN